MSDAAQQFHQRVARRLGRRIGTLEIELAVAHAEIAELRDIVEQLEQQIPSPEDEPTTWTEPEPVPGLVNADPANDPD